MANDFVYFCINYMLIVRCLILNENWLNRTQRSALLVKNNLKVLTSDTINGIVCEEFMSKDNRTRFNKLNNIFNNLSLQLADKFFTNKKNIYQDIHAANITSQNKSQRFDEDFQRKLIDVIDGIVNGLIDTNTENIPLLLEAFTKETSVAAISEDTTKLFNQYSCPNTINNSKLIYWHLKNSITKNILENKNKEIQQQSKIHLSSNKDKSNGNISLDDFLDTYLSKLLNNYFMSDINSETNDTINNEVFKNELNHFVASDEDMYSMNDTGSFENFLQEVITNEVDYISAYKNYEENIKYITNENNSKYDNYDEVYSEDLDDKDNDIKENNDTQDFEKRTNKLTTISIVIPFEIYECWYGHNKLRVLHQVRRMLWHKELANGAQEWALHLAIQNKGARHSRFYDEKGRKYGENIYRYKGAGMKHCHNAIFLWYGASEGYGFKTNKRVYASGHFMQVVWNNTRHFGVGIAYAHDQTWIVARYFPASNTAVRKIGDYVKKLMFGEARIKAENLRTENIRPRWVRTVQIKSSGETDCQDYDIYCNYYNYIGQCSEEATRYKCPKACRVCTTGSRINGGFTKWIEAEPCSTDCGVGKRREHRYCVSPEPMNGGEKCKGKRIRSVKCKDHTCIRQRMTCRDKDPNCFERLRKGHCSEKEYESYMRENCEMSCGMCKNCYENFDEDTCVNYAMHQKYCHIKSQIPFMSKKCQSFCCEYNRFFLTSGKELMKKLVRPGSRL